MLILKPPIVPLKMAALDGMPLALRVLLTNAGVLILERAMHAPQVALTCWFTRLSTQSTMAWYSYGIFLDETTAPLTIVLVGRRSASWVKLPELLLKRKYSTALPSTPQ